LNSSARFYLINPFGVIKNFLLLSAGLHKAIQIIPVQGLEISATEMEYHVIFKKLF
jgi:hypothetical protein